MSRRFNIILQLLGYIFSALQATGQQKVDSNTISNKMQWFADAKLGIFIHEGIYAVKGVDESWSFYNRKIDYASYMDQRKSFTLSKYDPAAWAELIRESGARYAVITTKHHDGFALHDSKVSDFDAGSKS